MTVYLLSCYGKWRQQYMCVVVDAAVVATFHLSADTDSATGSSYMKWKAFIIAIAPLGYESHFKGLRNKLT
jgi:hypothetical protein